MTSNSDKNKRIAKNTVLLYGRMFIMLIISLYTSRVVLKALGVDDYGIYTVVGGVVSMFTLLSGSLSAAISRYITYELGRGDLNKQKVVFSTSVNIQLILIAVLFLIFETVGLWFLNTKMVIPEGRLTAANWVFQFSVVTFAFNLLAVPYNASIISHEKMDVFAYISLFEAFSKLAVAFLILKNPFDRLIYYGLLLLIISIVIRFIYVFYCKRKFAECQYKFALDKTLTKEMLGFASWSFFGAGSTQLMNQGVDILSNVYFGVVVNAARGVANQVNGAVVSFVNSFTTAVNPQITKSYAVGDYEYMKDLVYKSAKYSYFLLLFFAIPIILETNEMLALWLVETPDHSVNFVRLIICISLVYVLSNSMVTAMLATGDIKKYQLIVGGLGLLVFPLAWICFSIGLPPESSYLIMLLIYILQAFARLYLLRSMIKISIKKFAIEVLVPAIKVSLISVLLPLIICIFAEESIYRMILTTIVSTIMIIVSVYFGGLSKAERLTITNLAINKIRGKNL